MVIPTHCITCKKKKIRTLRATPQYLINEMFENASKLSTAGKRNVALTEMKRIHLIFE